MNKKKAVYTSLTALALASFSATTFADEVAETAVAETTVALADEAVAEDTVVEASPEVAATETVVEETELVAEENNETVAVTDEEVSATEESKEEETNLVVADLSEVNAQIREGNTQAIAGTWQTEEGELLSISADGKLYSITYPEGHTLKPAQAGESIRSAQLTEDGKLDIANGGAMIYNGKILTRVSDEETTFDKNYWAWTGLENYTYDWSVNSIGFGTTAGEKGGHYHVFRGTYNGVPYELVYFRDTTNDGAPTWSDFNLPDDMKPVGYGVGPNIYYYVLPDGYIPTLKSQEEVVAEEETTATEENKEEETSLVVADLSEVNAQIKAGDTSAIAGTWQTEEGELLSISADGKLYSITYPEGHTLKPAQAGESIRSAQLTEDGKLDIANGGAMIYNGKLLTRVSEEETTFDKNYWAWTGLENYTYDWSVNSIGFGTTAGEKGGHYHVFRGTYNGVPYELVYFRDTTNDGAPTWSDFNLPDDMKPVGYGVGPNIYYYVLPDGYIPTLTGRRELADSNGTAVTVDVAVSDQVASVEVIDHIEPTEVNPTPIERLAGQDYDLYDITLKDAAGNPITTLKAVAVVKLPVDEGKTVERVIYLPENGDAETLAILKQEDGFVYFEASHFSHYGVVYLQTSTATETAETTETEEVVTTPTSSDKAVSTIAQGDGQAAASSTSTPSYSRVERAAEKSLPKTGEATSVLGLLGIGLTTLGTVVSKRRK